MKWYSGSLSTTSSLRTLLIVRYLGWNRVCPKNCFCDGLIEGHSKEGIEELGEKDWEYFKRTRLGQAACLLYSTVLDFRADCMADIMISSDLLMKDFLPFSFRIKVTPLKWPQHSREFVERRRGCFEISSYVNNVFGNLVQRCDRSGTSRSRATYDSRAPHQKELSIHLRQ